MSHGRDEMSVADEELIAAATQVIDRNGDDQIHTVGAALRDELGVVHVGVNVFHFTGGPCAELVVLGAARAAGAREPRSIVAVGDAGRGVLSPCGRDRQVFADHHPNLRVIVPTEQGPAVVRASLLLPHAYQVPGAAGASTSDQPSHDVSTAGGDQPPAGPPLPASGPAARRPCG